MIEEVDIQSREEAQALANFLYNERERHKDDIGQIERDLEDLKQKWDVRPRLRRVFVRP